MNNIDEAFEKWFKKTFPHGNIETDDFAGPELQESFAAGVESQGEEIKNIEKKLSQNQAIYNVLIDGAARDAIRINELKEDLKWALDYIETDEGFCAIYEMRDLLHKKRTKHGLDV